MWKIGFAYFFYFMLVIQHWHCVIMRIVREGSLGESSPTFITEKHEISHNWGINLINGFKWK